MQDKSHYTRYNYKKLYELAVEMFIRYGFSREDSEKVADVILTSDRFGVESHGVNRLTLYPFGIDIGRIKVDAKPEVVEDRLSMAVIDAHDGMGQLASIQGMQLAIDKAKKYGVGMVSVRNSNHFGIAGYYSMMAAKQGLMGVSMTNAEALVVPTYAREPMFGTNPIAVTIPADPHPFHMDFATSVMTCGKMEVYAKIGHELQPGMLVDETGTTCLDRTSSCVSATTSPTPLTPEDPRRHHAHGRRRNALRRPQGLWPGAARRHHVRGHVPWRRQQGRPRDEG